MLKLNARKLRSPKKSPRKKSRSMLNIFRVITKRLRFFRRKHGLNQFLLKKKRPTVLYRSFRCKYKGYSGEQLSWLQVISRLIGSVLPAILPWAILYGGYALLVSITHHFHAEFISKLISDSKVLPNVVLSFNIILSVLLVFSDEFSP